MGIPGAGTRYLSMVDKANVCFFHEDQIFFPRKAVRELQIKVHLCIKMLWNMKK
jgi:hypothetical protein